MITRDYVHVLSELCKTVIHQTYTYVSIFIFLKPLIIVEVGQRPPPSKLNTPAEFFNHKQFTFTIKNQRKKRQINENFNRSGGLKYLIVIKII